MTAYSETLDSRLVAEIKRCGIEELIHDEENWDTFDEVLWYLDNGDYDDLSMFISTLKYYGCDESLVQEVMAVRDSLE